MMRKIYYLFLTAFLIPTLILAQPPVNSDCADVEIQTLEIDGPKTTVSGSGTNAVNIAGLSYPQVWEAFTIDDCADVTIDYCNMSPAVANGFLSVYRDCPVDPESPVSSFEFGFETCDNLIISFYQLQPGTYYYPIMISPESSILDDYSVSFKAVTCFHPDTCNYYTDGPRIDFNNMFGGAPAADENGVCPTYQLTNFEAAAEQLFTIDNFVAGVEYTFDICEGPNAGSWSPSLAVIDPTDYSIVAFADGCSITWTSPNDGTYYIGITEVNACYSSGNTMPSGGANGYPTITCEGTITGLSDADKATFAVYPNPSNGQFTIGNVDVAGSYTIEVIDLAGRVIHSQVSALSSNTETKVNLNDVAAGVYMVKMINTNDNTQAVQRIVIK